MNGFHGPAAIYDPPPHLVHKVEKVATQYHVELNSLMFRLSPKARAEVMDVLGTIREHTKRQLEGFVKDKDAKIIPGTFFDRSELRVSFEARALMPADAPGALMPIAPTDELAQMAASQPGNLHWMQPAPMSLTPWAL